MLSSKVLKIVFSIRKTIHTWLLMSKNVVTKLEIKILLIHLVTQRTLLAKLLILFVLLQRRSKHGLPQRDCMSHLLILTQILRHTHRMQWQVHKRLCFLQSHYIVGSTVILITNLEEIKLNLLTSGCPSRSLITMTSMISLSLTLIHSMYMVTLTRLRRLILC